MVTGNRSDQNKTNAKVVEDKVKLGTQSTEVTQHTC